MDIDDKLKINNIAFTKKQIPYGYNYYFDDGLIMQVYDNGKIYYIGKCNNENIEKMKSIINGESKCYAILYEAQNGRIIRDSIETQYTYANIIAHYKKCGDKVLMIQEISKELAELLNQ